MQEHVHARQRSDDGEQQEGAAKARQLDGEAGELQFEVLPKGSDDLRPQLFKAADDNGLTLIGLAREGQNLEQTFRELTTSDDGSGKGGKAAAAKAS